MYSLSTSVPSLAPAQCHPLHLNVINCPQQIALCRRLHRRRRRQLVPLEWRGADSLRTEKTFHIYHFWATREWQKIGWIVLLLK